MQVTQADKKAGRVGVEEQHIKFRPSPNFKNMKKFLKSRSDYSESTSMASPAATVATTADERSMDKENKEIKPVVATLQTVLPTPQAVVVQPPLPPYPPPESPPLNVTIKQERQDEDEEVQNNSNSGEETATHQDTHTQPTEENISEQNQSQPKKTICKEFIRGDCKRPVCKYAHEVDVSQLAGVFTFCWNYQNAVCNFPNCRFVHATVFEEAEFYRTGVLPAHARRHLKKQQGPPPPPPNEVQPEIRPASFANPPPPQPNSMEQRPDIEDFRTPCLLPHSTSPLKREWGDNIEEFCTSPRDLEPSDHIPTKCKNCEIMDISLKVNKDMVENMIQSSEEIKKKMAQLEKKSNKLMNVLVTLLKPAVINKSLVSNGLMTGGDNEKSMLEQLGSYVGANNRMSSGIGDDSLKNIVGGNNISLSLVKLLCSAGEQNLPVDTSRET